MRGTHSYRNATLKKSRDHPRVCGEHILPVSAAEAFEGSSPRMRGTHGDGFARVGAEGIIPAYAGNTQVGPSVNVQDGDHPRVCGEHATNLRPNGRYQGSSPRMRGTPTCADNEVPWRGIIPAYAGNTYR